MEPIAQGKRSDTLGLPHSRVYAPCKGKSFNPLCCYSYLTTDLAVLKWNIVCISYSHLPHVLKLLPLQGATAPTRDTQGAASLALDYVLHWAFSPPLLNPKLELTVLYFRIKQMSFLRNLYGGRQHQHNQSSYSVFLTLYVLLTLNYGRTTDNIK